MPLTLKKRLPEYEFYREFNNTTKNSKTLLCFSLNRENKTLWDLWGYTYNDPCQSHAESIMLKEVARFFKENHPDTVQKYKLTLYMSFSPCYKCCESLANFLKSDERIGLHVRASKLYFPENSSNQKGLQQLKHLGVSIKCETNANPGNVSADIAALESSPLHTDPIEDNLTPDNNNRDRLPENETPHKHSIKDGLVGSHKGVKRKLSFED
ncbi:C-_U-editing enzyme APOBEC-1-like [Polyodon spathula]|uniref:C->U-editing enzyme APOBEC-1-like n=1 Tax=Polyodon spathula TaxID=7913 RepID=UPI001B7ECCBD|nr:C->U-editing enzyme APOBEC-1-like [Polyodon spathula]